MLDKTDSVALKTLIDSIPVNIEHDDALNIVSRYAQQHSVQVQKIIYYPYYWVLFTFTVKILFGKSRSIKASCLVDLINNQAATTDKFDFHKTEVLQDNVLEYDYSYEQAVKTAETYLTHSSIHNTKALFAPDYKILEERLVYKPFWIVKCTNRDMHSFRVIVDAVTGKFQLL